MLRIPPQSDMASSHADAETPPLSPTASPRHCAAGVQPVSMLRIPPQSDMSSSHADAERPSLHKPLTLATARLEFSQFQGFAFHRDLICRALTQTLKGRPFTNRFPRRCAAGVQLVSMLRVPPHLICLALTQTLKGRPFTNRFPPALPPTCLVCRAEFQRRYTDRNKDLRCGRCRWSR